MSLLIYIRQGELLGGVKKTPVITGVFLNNNVRKSKTLRIIPKSFFLS